MWVPQLKKCLLTVCALFSLASPVFAQDMFRVNAKSETVINKHGLCRVVVNNSATPIMVAARTPQEWSTGTNSFVRNVSDIPNVSLERCPPEEDDSCFFWVSGIGGTDTNDRGNNRARIGTSNLQWDAAIGRGGSNLVGVGEYPDSYGTRANPGPFFHAHNGSFDTIAVGADTTVEMYINKNFQGPVALRVTGPKLIVNTGYQSQPYFRNTWKNEDWSADSNGKIRSFVPSTREFIDKLLVPLPPFMPGYEFLAVLPPNAPGYESFYVNPAYPMQVLGTGSVKVTCSN